MQVSHTGARLYRSVSRVWIRNIPSQLPLFFCYIHCSCRYVSLDQVRRASRLEEEFQLEIWGVVEGGHDMDRLNNAVNLSSAGLLMQLLYDDATMKELLTAWHSGGGGSSSNSSSSRT